MVLVSTPGAFYGMAMRYHWVMRVRLITTMLDIYIALLGARD